MSKSVRYASGELVFAQKDLSSDGFGQRWGHTRSYSNRLSANPGNEGVAGASWFVKELPQLVNLNPAPGNPNQATIVVLGVISQAVWFDYVSGAYKPRFQVVDTLVHDGIDKFVYAHEDGRLLKFYDFATATPVALRGQFAGFSSPSGQATIPSRNGSNQITSFVQQPSGSSSSSSSSGSGGQPTTAYEYSYLSGGNNGGRLQTVTQKRGAVGVRRTQNSYYDTGSANGGIGDLQAVTLQQYNGVGWDTLATTYHRYYKAGDAHGFAHGLKYVVSPATYELMLNRGIVPESAADAVVATYADLYLEYDANQRVTLMRQSGTSTWTYVYTTSAFSNGYNNWKTKTEETLPDGNKNIVYTNFAGQVMFKIFKSGAQEWYEYFQYDSNGRMTLQAESSAVQSYNAATAGIVSMKSAAGLIKLSTYYSTTTASTTVAGGVAGYIQNEKLKQGSGGTPVLLRAWDYIASDAIDGNTIYPVASEIVNRSDAGGGSSPATTAYEYQWYSGTLQVQLITTTPPVIPTTQNGDNTAHPRYEYYDTYGRITWQQDALGFLSRTQYDNQSGAVVQRIVDVDTNVVSGAPLGWSTPSGGGLNLVTDVTVDSQGRSVQELGPVHQVSLSGVATNIRRAEWTVYQDVLGQTWRGKGYRKESDGSFTLINPVSITVFDGLGRLTEAISAARGSTSGALSASDSFPQSSWGRWARNVYGIGGILTNTQTYFSIPNTGNGTEGVNFNQTDYAYDTMKRLVREQSPGGTISWSVLSPQGDLLESWVGTDDTGAAIGSPGGAAPNNMVKVLSNVYDNGSDKGDRNLTSSIQYVDSSNSRSTSYGYDFRNRQVSIDGEIDFYQTQTYDNLDRITQTDRWNTYKPSGSSSSSSGTSGSSGGASGLGNLIGRTQTFYDNQGRIYQSKVFAVDPFSGAPGNSLVKNVFYDAVGYQTVLKGAANQAFTKQFYDGAGRLVLQYVGYAISGGDVVVEQQESTYDPAGNLILGVAALRFHDAPTTGTSAVGLLNGPSGANPKGRFSYRASYPDAAGRTVSVADYGTNGGSTLSRPSVVPSRSNSVLITSTVYDDQGQAATLTDPAGNVTQWTYDDAGRLTKLVEDYSASAGHVNRETGYTYNADGQVATLTAKNVATGDQTTTYAYGTSAATSDIVSGALLASVTYPDSVSGTDKVTFTYNRQGEVKKQTDQRGTVRELNYDLLGRRIHDRVTNLGSGVDGSVRRISTTYEVRGMVRNVTSYTSATVGSGTVVNDVQHVYNEFSQLTTQYQSHSGAVNVGTTPSVQYGYANGSANTIRPTSYRFPNLRIINLNYGTAAGLNDQLSRIGSLIDNTTSIHLADYTYVGLADVAQVTSPEPGIALTYIKQGAEPVGDGGDQYTGWDRFGRVIDQRWLKTSTGAALERIQYGFDRASNRLYRANLVAEALSANQDEYYTYDTLYQVLNSQRGTLNAGRTGITSTPTREEGFTLDPTGNWSNYLNKVAGATTLNQGRTHNKANETTQISGASTMIGCDGAGNVTLAPQPSSWLAALSFVYDAWNRLVSVSNAPSGSSGSGTLIATYRYDGMDRRVSNAQATTRHYYYTEQWQLVEERVGAGTTADKQFVWGLRYPDDLVTRDAGATRYYALHDYFNCTAVTDTSGAVQERYGYNAYGQVRFMDASFGSRATSTYGWETLYADYRYDSESGLYQVRNRYLHPTLGRWLSRDPLGYAEGLNLYSYVGNRAINAADPLGLARDIPSMVEIAQANMLAGSSYTFELWICVLARENYQNGVFNRTTNKKSGAAGYGQFLESTAQDIATRIAKYRSWNAKLKNPQQNKQFVDWFRSNPNIGARIPYGINAYDPQDGIDFDLNNGTSLYQAIIASEDVDLTASSWYLQDRWLEAKGSKSGAIKKYGDGSQDYINAVLNCEVCLLAHPGDYNYWKKVFDKIQVQPLEGKVQTKCCLD